jgi:hypothetical protein
MEENNKFNAESNSAKKLKAFGETEEIIHSPKHDDVEIDKKANFWYYHKWTVIICAFFAVVLLVFVITMATKKKNDIQVIYAGPVEITASLTDMQNAFASLNVDYNNDNTGRVLISKYIYKSLAEIEKEKAEADKRGEQYDVTNQLSISGHEKNTLNQVLISGEFSVMLFSPVLYEENSKNMCTVKDVLGYELDSDLVTPDGKGVYFKKTEFAKENPCFDVLPDDTILCILVKTYNVKDKDYQNRQDFFKAIIEY